MHLFSLLRAAAFGAAYLLTVDALAQVAVGPPAVGVVTAEFRPMAESTEINGRIQAIQRVDIVARVTAFFEREAVYRRRGGQEGRYPVSARKAAVRG